MHVLYYGFETSDRCTHIHTSIHGISACKPASFDNNSTCGAPQHLSDFYFAFRSMNSVCRLSNAHDNSLTSSCATKSYGSTHCDLWQAVPPYIDVTGCAYWQRQGWHYHLWFLSTSMRAKLRESLPMITMLESVTSAGMSARPSVKQI